MDVDSFAGDCNGGALRSALGVAEDEVLVGMSASLSATWKQHAVFVEMAARLAETFPRVRFVAFGSEPRRTGRRVYDRTWRYYQGLQEQVQRLGEAGRRHTAAHYSLEQHVRQMARLLQGVAVVT